MVGFNGKKLIYLQPKSVYECNLNEARNPWKFLRKKWCFALNRRERVAPTTILIG
jgi:hypothetical protein